MIQVPSHDTPLNPNNQGRTFQDLNIGAVHIKVVPKHGGIQVPFHANPSMKTYKQGQYPQRLNQSGANQCEA